MNNDAIDDEGGSVMPLSPPRPGSGGTGLPGSPSDEVTTYRPPTLTRLGTLDELTQGAITVGTDDGLAGGGGNGDGPSNII